MMDIVPHVDIVGDDRIQAILDDPNNFNLRAIRAETVLDWIPDLGQYAAPAVCRSQNGLFRTPGLAQSGLPATLRHRFFMEEEAVRVVGTRYVGLLIYDSEDDDYTFELSAGSVEVGAVRPWRHDNRRHLIVAHEPVEILGGHIPFTVRAVGTGMCYLESVIIMPQSPEPSPFVPEIKCLTARVVERGNETVVAEVHFVTCEAATASVEAIPEGGAEGKVVHGFTDEPEKLHIVTLRDLRPNTRYRVGVCATEKEGARAEASLALDTGAILQAFEKAVTVPIEILRLGRTAPAGIPLTFGVPVAEGKMTTPRRCVLYCGGEELMAQTRVHAHWPDGSARWVLVDVPCPKVLGESRSAGGELLLDQQSGHAPDGLSWEANAEHVVVEGQQLRASVSRRGPLPVYIERRTEHGDWQKVFGKGSTCVTARLGNGLQLANGMVEELRLEEAGPERATIRYELPILDRQGIAHFRSIIRLHVYARMPFIRLMHRVVVTSPALGDAFRSDNLDYLTAELEHVRSAIVGTEGEARSLLDVQSLELTLPWRGDGDGTHRRVVHEHDKAHRVEWGAEVKQQDGHWPGILALTGTQTNFALCVKNFWQTHPKGVRCDDDSVAVEIFPELSGEELPDYDESWHRLYFWYDSEKARYRLKVGMAFTTEMLIGFPEQVADAEAWQEWLQRPTVVRPEANYLNSTNALLPIAPKEGSPHPHYEAMMDRALEEWVHRRDERREYGFASFGDTYSDSEHFWSNGEYDSAFSHYVEFLRGGDPRWYLLGNQATRHLIDIDTCNYSRQHEHIGAQYMHTPGHMGGFLPPFFRSKSHGSISIPSHTWVEGPVLHYLLTGEETVRSVIEQTGLRLTRNLRYYSFGNMRECGWHIIHLCGLARMENDPRFLNAAAIIVERVLEKQSPGGGWDHPLAEAHCHCEPPRCHGEAGFMVGVLLTGLRRYYELSRDTRVAEAIVGGAKWLIDKTYVQEAGLFRYTSCPNHHGPAVEYTVMLAEALADACTFARDPLLAEALRRSLDNVGVSHTWKNQPRYGRFLTIEARYIPTMLYVLQESNINTGE
jgi:hypothetical protein